jgi:hypothetical protein
MDWALLTGCSRVSAPKGDQRVAIECSPKQHAVSYMLQYERQKDHSNVAYHYLPRSIPIKLKYIDRQNVGDYILKIKET